MKNIMGISWAAPENYVWGLLLIVALLLLWYRWHRTQRAARALAKHENALSLLAHFSLTKIAVRSICFALGLTALFLALLRPQWGIKQEIVVQEGRDLFVALDISRSMLAQDCAPNRLALAKKKIHALLSQLSCERVGLILFSGSAFIQCPLTSDYAAFFMFLDHIDVETISSGTTALDAALEKAVEAFASTPDRKNKIVLVITDGEDFSSNLSEIKQEISRVGMHIFTLGVGTCQGAPIPLFNDAGAAIGHQKDKRGAVVISRLNEEILDRLAQDSSGVYVRASEDNADVKTIAKLVQRYEKEKFDDKKITQFQDRYYYFLIVSFICFALEWLL